MRYFSASRPASIAAVEAVAGRRGAMTGTGDSPLRPYSACSRSACSVLVGRPVDGPPRWMSQITSGSSSETASPIVSALRHMPGPEVVVTPSAPPNAAPSAAPMPAISSSAWNVRTPNRLCLDSSCRMSEAGRDRVGAEEQRQPGEPGRGDQADGQGACCR